MRVSLDKFKLTVMYDFVMYGVATSTFIWCLCKLYVCIGLHVWWENLFIYVNANLKLYSRSGQDEKVDKGSFYGINALFNRFSKNVTPKVFRQSCTLTTHSWQKWKRVFLTCPCHEIYRDEAVGLLKSSKYTWKIMIFLQKCEIWGNIMRIWLFVNNCFNWSLYLRILLHMCDTHNCDIWSTTHFSITIFS